jgi:NAD(P)-dependent dehydrogenase (short-subunit alcohol dehydrogenase family)
VALEITSSLPLFLLADSLTIAAGREDNGRGSERAMGRTEGKIAIVTGAASGIGRAAAVALAREGAAVVATDLDAAGAEATAATIEEAGGRAVALRHDVGEEEDWEAVIDAALAHFRQLDVLVNNAGLGIPGGLLDTSLAEWRRVMRVNLDGVFLGTRAAVAAMSPDGKRRGTGLGSIVNVSSVLGIVGGTDVSAYSASKGGVRLFTKAAALECAAKGWGIRVNSVHPGYIWTPMVEAGIRRRVELSGSDAAALRAALEERHPAGRLGNVEDIAGGILYLASEESAFMTGAELVLDGGYTAR